VPVKISESGSSISAKYTPTETGDHLIEVSIAGRPISGSPFRVAVFNAHAIKVGRVPQGVVGRPVEIESKSSRFLRQSDIFDIFFRNSL